MPGIIYEARRRVALHALCLRLTLSGRASNATPGRDNA
jgi:hypothetical protein